MSFHERIRDARKAKGLTQEDLGRLIGVAKTTVSGYERDHEPTAAQLGAIADALDTDVSFLLQDEVKNYKGKYHSISDEAMKIAGAFDRADEDRKETVRVALKPYMEIKKEDAG